MYPESIKDIIVDGLAEFSLRRLCQAEGMPDRRTVERWMAEDADFAARCARARSIHAFRIVDSTEEIEEDVLSGVVKADAARVVISSRQWRASKLDSKKFGDKIEQTHQAGDSIKSIVRTIVGGRATD